MFESAARCVFVLWKLKLSNFKARMEGWVWGGREVNQGQIFACDFSMIWDGFIWCPVVFSKTLVGLFVIFACPKVRKISRF